MASIAQLPLALGALMGTLGATLVLAEQGIAEITSEPRGAMVFVDGQRKGTTPTQPDKALVLELPEGEHRIEAVIDGPPFRKAIEQVFVPGAGIQPVHLVTIDVERVIQEAANQEAALTEAINPKMVRIATGNFFMACQPREQECGNNESPAHRVNVPAFDIGKYEVTFAEWDACWADGGCSRKPGDREWGRGNRPVINVSWDDAQQYVTWLSAKSGQLYRLPSEAEWEYAAGRRPPRLTAPAYASIHGTLIMMAPATSAMLCAVQ